MELTFAPMTEEDARAIQAWRYEREYAIYNMEPDDPEGIAELLDRRSPYYAARDEQSGLVGYVVFGVSAGIHFPAPPALYDQDGAILVGLGLRPDLTGKGLGLAFVQAAWPLPVSSLRPAPFGSLSCRSMSAPSASTSGPALRASGWSRSAAWRANAPFWRCAGRPSG